MNTEKKSTIYFLNLEKGNHVKKHTQKLYINDSTNTFEDLKIQTQKVLRGVKKSLRIICRFDYWLIFNNLNN